MQGATKVGALVVAFAILLWGAYAILGRSLFARPTARYYALFSDAGGAVPGTRVMMAGVQVGTVSEVALRSPTLARLTLELDPDHRIPVGSEAVIPGALIAFGEAQLNVVPPAGPVRGYLASGAELPGRKGGALDEILPESRETVRELTKTLTATRKLLEDQGLRKDVRAVLQTSNETLRQFGALSQQTQGLIAENRVLIRGALRNATAAMADVREGTQILTRILREGRVEQRTIALMDRLNRTSARAEHLVASVDRFISDPNLQNPIRETVQNTAKISESGTRIAASTERIAANGEVVSAKAIEIADKASELADEAKRALQDVRGFLGRGSRPRPLGIGGSMDLMRQSDPAYWRTDIEFSTRLAGSGIHVGLWDAFESNRLIAQVGRDAGKGAYLRYGIYAAKPGVGVDYRITDRFLLRGDLFDINDPRLDLRARVELGRGLYGWVGMDRIFKKNAPTVGIGFQK